MAVALLTPETGVGVVRWVVVPSPSWPEKLAPQQWAVPSLTRAQVCEPNHMPWAVMAVTIGLVMATELLNTAIEALADHLHPQQHEAIKITKDVAAAAVLVSSMSALMVGGAFVVDQVLPWLGISLR